jgi:uncharacterized protein (TIGR00251 family)
MLHIREGPGGARFAVRVQPRASRSEILGVQGDALRVRLTAAPVEGAANAALVELLADRLSLPRGQIHIVAGATSRNKIVGVVGVSAEAVLARLAPDSACE